MSLRRKTIYIISLTSIITGLVLFTIINLVLMRNLTTLEEQYVLENTQRAMNAVNEKLVYLDRFVGDWAAWDDTYKFINDKNNEYIQSNLVDSMFINADINVVAYVDLSGNLVYLKAYDLQDEKEEHLSVDLIQGE